MPLHWLVHEIDGKRVVYVQEAGALIFALLALRMAGEPVTPDNLIEHHVLTSAIARKIPTKMRGRALSEREARTLIEKIGG
jgi:hypothetical protein